MSFLNPFNWIGSVASSSPTCDTTAEAPPNPPNPPPTQDNKTEMSSNNNSSNDNNTSNTTAATSTPPRSISDALIAIVLDASGSMEIVRGKILEGVNQFIKEQQTITTSPNDETRLTVVKFANECETIYKPMPLKECKPLSADQYETDGGTALYDAVGSVLTRHQDEKNCLVVIVTDGEENSSKHHNHKEVMDLIEARKASGWRFIYLASDMSVSKQGASLGIHAAKKGSVTTGSHNVAVGMQALGRALGQECSAAVSKYRQEGEMSSSSFN